MISRADFFRNFRKTWLKCKALFGRIAIAQLVNGFTPLKRGSAHIARLRLRMLLEKESEYGR